MLPVPKKVLVIIGVLMLLIIFGVFIYIQFLFIEIDKGSGPTEVSRVFECKTLVENKKEAADCYNVFFEETLDNLIDKRSKENISDQMIDMYSKEVKEEDIFIFENTYQIKRDGHGTPYFIEEGYVKYR